MKARILPAVLSASILLPGQVRAPGAGPLGEFNTSLVRLAERITPAVVLVVSNGYRPVAEEDAAAPVALQPAAGSHGVISASRPRPSPRRSPPVSHCGANGA